MRSKYSIIFAAVAFVAFLYPASGFATILRTADEFGVLGSSTVTNTGSSSVTGSVGVSAGSAIVGFDIPGGPGTASGTIHAANAITAQAQLDANAAYFGLSNMPFTQNLTGQDLGALTLSPGVYHFDSTAQLTGPLTLDGQGNNNAFWVFQVGSALTTASASSVLLINGGSDNGVYWQIGSSATLGTGTSFRGNIIANQSITLTTGANIGCGGAIALNGAVTLDTNSIGSGCGSGGLTIGAGGAVEPLVVPVIEEPPVVEEPPVEEPPVAEEPPVEEPPVAEEPPVEEPPVAEEPPAAEEPPVVIAPGTGGGVGTGAGNGAGHGGGGVGGGSGAGPSVPEPISAVLFLLGGGVLAARKLRKKK